VSAPYTGNPIAIQAPSPPPGPRVIPIASLIADTDGNTAANLYQAWKVCADFIAFTQNTVGLDLPVLNASGSGFTTVTYSAFGGTVTPSGARIADGLRVTIQIQLGGAVGVATFKTSTDGGNTYGALQTTAASMTCATTGITLAFVGTLTAAGTAAFRSAFTPLASWVDQAGNLRQYVDHNGYMRGRLNHYYEDYLTLGPNQIAGANTNTTGRLYWTIPAAASLACGSGGAGNMPGTPSLNFIGSNVANATTTRAISAGSMAALVSYTTCVIQFEVSLTATANDFKVGLTNAAAPTGAPAAGQTEVCLLKQAADTNWQLLTSNGAASTKTNTGVAPTTLDQITIEFQGSASPYGATQARMWINGAFVASTTSNVPQPAQTYFAWAATTTNATNSINALISPVDVIFNRNASGTAI
jgi:hypothetical protein